MIRNLLRDATRTGLETGDSRRDDLFDWRLHAYGAPDLKTTFRVFVPNVKHQPRL
jgi:hypothetical protein